MTTPQTSTQFVSSLGVNVHVEYTDGKYANAGNVIADLNYLGIDNVRDAVLNPQNQGQASYDALASAGVKFDMFFQGNELTSTLHLVDAFAARHPGAIALIEGPNEVNNFPISYAGQSGDAGAVAYQNALYSAVRSDASLVGVPVADLTSYPFLKGGSDDANYHFYPFHGEQPGAAYGATGFSDLASAEPGKAMVMTEGGYNTLLADSYFGGVDQLTQAKLTLNLYCDNAKAGVNTSYIYQLLDAYADPTNLNSDSHFGVFNLDNSPKIAATAIHNLTTTLSSGADPNAVSSPLAFEAQGLASPNDMLTLTKSATVHDVLIWDEPTIWNSATTSEVAATPTPATLHFDDAANVSVFDPLVGTAPVATYLAAHDVTISVTDHPLIVEVSTPTSSSLSATLPPLPAPVGTDAADTLQATAQGGIVLGLGGNDTIVGGAGADMLFGNVGDDSLTGGDGSDTLFGGKDNDVLFGDAGNDVLFGNLGVDTLHGGTGADTLFGGQGNDVLFGDDGNDWLSGDLGDDTLTGGAGADTFSFAPGSGHDVVTDFTKGQDRLDISAYVQSGAHVTISDDAQGAHIAFSTGDSIELYGIHAADLTVSSGWIV